MEQKNDLFYILRGEHIIVLKALKDTGETNFSYCLPLNYKEQIPLLLTVGGDYQSYSIIKEEGKYNKKLETKIPKMKKNDRKKIFFSYIVLIKKSSYDIFPNKMYFPENNDIPEDIKKYLASTESVRSKNLFIKIWSRILKGFSNNLFYFVKKVNYWNAYHGTLMTSMKIFPLRNPFLRKYFVADTFWLNGEDSMSALFFGAHCIGKTNLATALMRSRGIPARVLISDSPFFGKEKWLDSQHYCYEFYCKEFGWITTQSGVQFSYPNRNVLLKIVEPKEENIAGTGFSEYGGAVPWFYLDNKDMCFGLVDEFNLYNVPKDIKKGFPILRCWREKSLEIPQNISKEIEKLSSDVWELYTSRAGNFKDNLDFKNAYKYQKKAVESLIKNVYQKNIEFLKKSKELYLKLKI
jgi:hypothetical protein